MLLAPRCDRVVDAQQARVRADEEPEDTQHGAADDEHGEREHEEEAGLRSPDRIERRPVAEFEVLAKRLSTRCAAATAGRVDGGVDAGMATHRQCERRTDDERGPEEYEGDEHEFLPEV